jgi:hypothetical protein
VLALVLGASALPAQRIGEFSLRGGVAIATAGDSVTSGAGPSVEASWGTRFGRVVVLLEGGYLGVSSVRHVWRYGVGARYEFGHGEWRPYLVGGFGGYDDSGRRIEYVDGTSFTSDLSWFGVNGGVGVRKSFGRSPLALLAESRLHVRVQNVQPETNMVRLELVTVLVGGTVSW